MAGPILLTTGQSGYREDGLFCAGGGKLNSLARKSTAKQCKWFFEFHENETEQDKRVVDFALAAEFDIK